jgi:hypothetical protein
MHYKTIVLELLQQRPQFYDQLLENRTLLATINLYARQLRDIHLDLKERLLHAKPESNLSQLASKALEIALQELQDGLPRESQPDDSKPLTLEAAMAFIHRHTPPA